MLLVVEVVVVEVVVVEVAEETEVVVVLAGAGTAVVVGGCEVLVAGARGTETPPGRLPAHYPRA